MSKNTYTSKAKAKTYVDKAQNRRIRQIEAKVNSRELKNQDVSSTFITPTWAGSVFNLIAPNIGDADSQRTGDQIGIESIRLKFNAGMTGTGTGGNQLRVLIVRDKGASIGSSTSNVLEAAALNTVNAAHGPFQNDLRQNFEVYYDKTFMLDHVSHYQVQGSFVKKFKKPKLCKFLNGTTTATAGQWKMILVSDLLTPNIGFNYWSRIQFSDL